MDHRVAKDMISSGMIPSGEKKKEDLGRPQYGTVPSPNALADAYKSMYDKKEEVINEHHQKDKDGNTIPHEDEEVNEGKIPAGLQAYLDKKKGKKEDKKDMKEQYDLVYEHLIGEGFSEEETFEKMSNLTEEQLDEFMKALATRAAQYGANLGKPASQKINVINPKRKPFDPKPKERKPFDPKPKPGDSDFRAKSASDVVNAAAAMRRKDPVDNTKTGSRTNKTEDVDLFDVVSGVFVAEGYGEKDAYKVMSQLTEEQLNEIAISGTIATVGAGLLKGMLGAGKVAAAAGKGLASAGKAAAVKGMTAAKSAASGLKSVAKTGMTKASDALGKVSNIAKDKTKGMGDTMKNIGKGVGDDVKDEIKRKILQGDDGGSNKITKTGQISTGSKIAASADLFDIVKGQLLDEGLSEEEIKDIMLTLTPDEIMEELSDIVKRNDALNRERAMKAAQERKVPDKVREASKRQYTAGGPKDKGENKYTTQDKKTIIDYNKNKESM